MKLIASLFLTLADKLVDAPTCVQLRTAFPQVGNRFAIVVVSSVTLWIWLRGKTHP